MHPDFASRIITWQRAEGRHDLPWQPAAVGHDSYPIWLSEIMLQQTQVATVIPYFQRFLARFPRVEDLAAAPVEAVTALWAGLGYYARARNLHACAQAVVREHGGKFPAAPAELASLPGIGRSTAAAIAAFAHGTRAAILDGNVKRVLCRVFGIHGDPASREVENRLWALAESLLPERDLGAYTQGLMDLGAGLCRRSRPACVLCPMTDACVARREGLQAVLPEKKSRAALQERRAVVAVLQGRQGLWLERRPPTGIWGGLLSLPEAREADELESLARARGLEICNRVRLPEVVHTFTHFRLRAEPWLCEVVAGEVLAEPAAAGAWYPWSALADLGLPTPWHRLLTNLAPSPS